MHSISFHFLKEETNLYTILEAKSNMKQKEIKLAYYKQAKKYHPDFLGPTATKAEENEASEMFKKIQMAYETLSNPIMR
jgi:DnaJ-class molecular chaperone